MASLQAPAKLNLGLRIVARRPDGYHEIETIFLPIDLCDEVEVREAEPGIRVRTSSPALPTDRRNLAFQAAERVCAALGVEPALSIRIEKRIPIGAGLGGGSSDAAATILGAERLLGRRLPGSARREVALGLGADVPFFLNPRPAVGRGIGERLETVPGVPEMTWLLVAFPFGISTRESYAEASRELTLPRRGSSIAALLGPSGVRGSPSNDLEPVAVRRHPEIRQARRALERVGAPVTGMSGSGPTVYGHFAGRSEAEEAARLVKLPHGAATIVVSSPGNPRGKGNGA